ncbi:hypothetical protein BUALT_Bualt18G0023700 [Buddleja alternifolia]|uniref:Late embryogenesis abundant protein LEA-2 subgroup domain-containing protein n=1 Tax=Buddleja alternifolia TaxID=168488 RepID=A0AAV6WCG9_9LAMI|nr:hypothetical protein BUALT_Bualt18G0023700 [Buddleja alternifolia]
MYDPKLPSYNIDGIEVKAFDIQPDNNTLNTELVIAVYAENPNKKIGFDYIKGSWMDVKYSDINICGGDLPEFEQDNKNTTHMHVSLKGKTQFGSGLQQSLAENRRSQKIPLVVKLNVLVSVVLGKLQLRSCRVSIACNIVVDNLDPNKQINIISRETEIRARISSDRVNIVDSYGKESVIKYTSHVTAFVGEVESLWRRNREAESRASSSVSLENAPNSAVVSGEVPVAANSAAVSGKVPVEKSSSVPNPKLSSGWGFSVVRREMVGLGDFQEDHSEVKDSSPRTRTIEVDIVSDICCTFTVLEPRGAKVCNSFRAKISVDLCVVIIPGIVVDEIHEDVIVNREIEDENSTSCKEISIANNSPDGNLTLEAPQTKALKYV